ncbi:MAG: CoB--CoM heterodisulfide reductase iron-sulfur subunit B family protein [Deltaproteobacteria bacterium]|nr:CoB--CoM heterodisulfide reductase iron-sulfur subunit B family protein [Deltaproteobacteria bacterium]
MKLGYFPGCSLHATARECEESLRAIAAPLDVELAEIDDWACCGATSAHATNHLLSVALPARTLALAERQGFDTVLAPCAACYARLASARHELAKDKALLERVAAILERPFTNAVKVVSIAELLRDLAPKIREQAKRPLGGARVAAYYGCLLVRPTEVSGFDDAEQPSSMEAVIAAAGGTPVEWRRKVDCCGAGFSLSRTGSVIRLGRAILEDAKKAGAEAIAVGCPMCHSNLDLRQKAMSRTLPEPLGLPILFLSQVVGLGLGLDPQALGLGRHFVGTGSFVAKVTAPPAPAEKPAETKQEVA